MIRGERRAILLAVLATPLVPGFMVGVFGGVVNFTLKAALFCFVAAYLVSLPLVVVLGLPVFLLIRHLEWLRWWTALLAGLPFGVAVWLAIRSPGTSMGSGVFLASVGSLSALVFWLTWRRSSRYGSPEVAHGAGAVSAGTPSR